MTDTSSMQVVIVGAGINGLVAANYLRRAGCRVTLIERAARVGGACVPATAVIDGVRAGLRAWRVGAGPDAGFRVARKPVSRSVCRSSRPHTPSSFIFPGTTSRSGSGASPSASTGSSRRSSASVAMPSPSAPTRRGSSRSCSAAIEEARPPTRRRRRGRAGSAADAPLDHRQRARSAGALLHVGRRARLHGDDGDGKRARRAVGALFRVHRADDGLGLRVRRLLRVRARRHLADHG